MCFFLFVFVFFLSKLYWLYYVYVVCYMVGVIYLVVGELVFQNGANGFENRIGRAFCPSATFLLAE